MSTNTVNLKVLVCALIAMAPNALLMHEFNVSTEQAQITGQTSPDLRAQCGLVNSCSCSGRLERY